MRTNWMLLLLFFLFFANISYGQNQDRAIDSLKRVLSTTKEDTIKVNILNSIVYKLWMIGDYNIGMDYANEALSIAEKIKFDRGIAKLYTNIGNIYSQQGNYPEALKAYLASLKASEKIGFKISIARAYNNIGIIYSKQNNYIESLKNYQTSLVMFEAIGDKNGIENVYLNIGNVYNDQKDYPKALDNYINSLKIAEKIMDKKVSAIAYNNIGDIYFDQNNYTDALKNLLISLKIEEDIGDKEGIANVCNGLGGLLTELKKFSEARKNFKRGEAIANEIGSNERLIESYAGLAKLDSLSGNYKESVKYLNLYIAIKDKLLNQESDKQISELKIQYETEKKEKKIIVLNKNNEIKTVRIEKQKVFFESLIGGFLLLTIFAAIVIWFYNQKQKIAFRHQLLATEMKALRSQMNPHFTFNVLNSIQYFINENDMESAELYLEKFSSLIRMILEQSRTSYITVEEEVEILKLYLDLEEMRFVGKFSYSLDIDSDIDIYKILIPSMLIQPIVENAIKHGIEHKEGSALINISFSMRGTILVCKIRDNGIGRVASEKLKINTLHKSVATDIIKERIKALSSIYNIHLSYEIEDLFSFEGNPEGTCVSMEIPTRTKTEDFDFEELKTNTKYD